MTSERLGDAFGAAGAAGATGGFVAATATAPRARKAPDRAKSATPRPTASAPDIFGVRWDDDETRVRARPGVPSRTAGPPIPASPTFRWFALVSGFG